MHRSAFGAVAGVLAAVAVGGGGLVSAQTYPTPTGYVSDYAGVLSTPSRTALAARLATVDRHRGIQIAVVTVTSLDGQTVERYATGLFNTWGVGRAGTNTGVLVLVAPRDRQMRIEVGKGLERVLTNDIAAGLVDEYFLPAFREKRVQHGIEVGVERIIAILQAGPARSPAVEMPVERPAVPLARAAAPPRSTPIGDVLGVLRAMPRPFQLLLLVIGLTIGAARIGKGFREHAVLVPLGLLICAAVFAAWSFPLSGWGIPGWLLLGGWTWLVFSAAWKPPPAVVPAPAAETTAPSPISESSAASTATPDDQPELFRNFTRGDSFGHDDDDQFWRSRRRDRDRDDSDRSGGSGGFGGFGGGSSSGGGASGKW